MLCISVTISAKQDIVFRNPFSDESIVYLRRYFINLKQNFSTVLSKSSYLSENYHKFSYSVGLSIPYRENSVKKAETPFLAILH